MNQEFKDGLPSRPHSFLLRVLTLAAVLGAPLVGAPPPQRGEQPIVVQVGAYRGPTASGRLAAELEQKGFEPIVVPGDDYYRVVVGPFADTTEANAMMARLKEQGYDSYLRRDLALPPQAAQRSSRTEAPARQPAAAPRATPPPAQPQTAPREPPPARATPAAPTITPQPATREPLAQPTPRDTLPQPAPPPQAQAAPDAPAATQPAQPPAPPATPVRPAETAPTAPAPQTAPPSPEPPAATAPAVTANQPPAQPPPIPRPGVPTRPAEPAPEPAAPAAAAQQAQALGQERVPSRLRILVLEGQGAINNIKQRTSRDPVIQVVDENDRPVAGVAVVFALPSRGASGVFANGARSLTILTDAQGMATATGLTPNSVAGDLAIQVSASHQGQTASTVIAQTNVAAGAGMSAATIGILGAIAAGAAVGAVVAFSGNESTPPGGGPTTPPTSPPSGTATVRPGGVTIGAP